MSKAKQIKRQYLDRMTEKFVGNGKRNEFHGLRKKNSVKLTEAVSKDSIVDILDQILEYSTRSKKDLDTDNADMLKVDLAQIILFADQLKSLIEEDAPADTGGDTAMDSGGEETASADTEVEEAPA